MHPLRLPVLPSFLNRFFPPFYLSQSVPTYLNALTLANQFTF